MPPTITKTALAAARSCDVRAYRSLIKGDRWTAPRPPTVGALIGYRARHTAVAAIHRLWLRRSTVDPAVLPDLWANAWMQAGGSDEPDPEGLAWLEGYVADDPFGLAPRKEPTGRGGAGRRLVAVEQTLRTPYLGRTWQARPDLLVEAEDGGIEALELSGARHPLLDRQAVEAMAAIDTLVMGGPGLPAPYCARPHRVIVCALQTHRETDVTLPWPRTEGLLADIDAWLAELATGVAVASPSADACAGCPYREDCPDAWGAPTRLTASMADATSPSHDPFATVGWG